MAEIAALARPCPNHADVVTGLVDCARCGVAYCPDCLVQVDGRPYDLACKEEVVRDLRSGTSSTTVATVARRFGALLIDSLLFTPIWFVIAFKYANPKAGLFDAPLQRIVLPAIFWTAYEAVLLAGWNGQTFGKRALGIRVRMPDGSPITTGRAVWRAVSRNLMAYTYLPGLVDMLMIFSSSRRTLHDRAAGTVVVMVQR